MSGGRKRDLVAISGASGTIYGLRLIEALLAAPEREVHLIVTPAAARVMHEEMEITAKLKPFEARSFLRVSEEQAARITLHAHSDIGAGPASGTFRAEAMIVCPCSVKSLGALAAGLADNLLTRAGDVALKEGRPLVLVVRETPLSQIHLKNMLTLSQAGAVILPASPGFYHKPQTIEELVGHVVQKVMDRLGLETAGATRWKENEGGE